MRIPTSRTPGRYAVALVCLGNICRSPMADVVLTERIRDAGLEDVVEVASCGTGDWHVGRPMDERAAATLSARGYDPSRHRARQFDPSWLERHDLVLAMDDDNLSALSDGTGPTDRLRKFRDFDPEQTGADVPDPYYGGPAGFEEVLRMVERTSAALVDALARELVPETDDRRP